MTPDATTQQIEGTHSQDQADLELLRQILSGTSHLELREVRERVEDPEKRARDVGDVLARAIVIRSKEDGQLAAAMRPTIETTLSESVRRNPQAIVDVIFPIIGPAIRKAISQSMATMVGSVNRTVESAFTFRGLKWRLQAWRTGKSYAEVALTHNLVYRVEQIFLIHRKNGLLISHAVNIGQEADEPEVVSGMLTAIRDFVHDSFGVEEGSGLDTFRVGDLNLLIEQGSQAVLAAVIRGIPPPNLREQLQGAVETVHADYQAPLASFEGDTGDFAGVEAVLEACFSEQRKEQKQRSASSFLFWTLIVGGILALVSWWVVASLRAGERAGRWADYVEALRDEPGLVVTHASEPDEPLAVYGLRDPQARDPLLLLEGAQLDQGEVSLQFISQHAPHPPFVLARLARALRPLPTVDMRLDAGVLHVRGRAPSVWVDELRRLAPLAVGVTSVDARELARDADLAAYVAVVQQVEALRLTGEADEASQLATWAETLQTLAEAGESAAVQPRVRVIHDGDREDLVRRAGRVYDTLRKRSLPVVGVFPAEGEGEETGSAPGVVRLVCETRLRAAAGDADK